MKPFSPSRESAAQTEQERWLTDELKPHEVALRGYLLNSFPSVDADEVIQESYVKLLKARTLGRIASVKAYFFSTARNTAITLFKRGKLYSETPVGELPSWRVLDSAPNPADIADSQHRLEMMGKALDQLPARCRDVMRLAVLEGMSNAEIADELGLAENTVRVHLARGIKRCADYLREQGERR